MSQELIKKDADGNIEFKKNVTVDGILTSNSIVSILWSELKALRDASTLKAGQQYRITDYSCATSHTETQSAGHTFDIIVIADDVNKINESARVCAHEGDTYFASSNLSAWKIKYCIDNDTARFSWAVSDITKIYTDDALWFSPAGSVVIGGTTYYKWYNANFDSGEEGALAGILVSTSQVPAVGDACDVINSTETAIIYEAFSSVDQVSEGSSLSRGVIYEMEDEFGNKCPYDFKNIQFKRYAVTDDSDNGELADLDGLYLGFQGDMIEALSISDTADFIWCYTFTWNDNNVIKDGTVNIPINNSSDYASVEQQQVTDNYIGPAHIKTLIDNDTFQFYPQLLNNIVMFSTPSNGGFSVRCNNFANGCYNMSFVNPMSNSFKTDCNSIIAGEYSLNNIFGNYCHQYAFGSRCVTNIFGNDCSENRFGSSFRSNTFGNECCSNIFGNECLSNTFGNNCVGNIFGDNCYHNTFGNDCLSNKLGYISGGSYNNYCKDNIFDNSIQSISLTSNMTGSYSACLQNVHIHAGAKNKTVSVARNLEYSTDVYITGSVDLILD